MFKAAPLGFGSTPDNRQYTNKLPGPACRNIGLSCTNMRLPRGPLDRLYGTSGRVVGRRHPSGARVMPAALAGLHVACRMGLAGDKQPQQAGACRNTDHHERANDNPPAPGQPDRAFRHRAARGAGSVLACATRGGRHGREGVGGRARTGPAQGRVFLRDGGLGGDAADGRRPARPPFAARGRLQPEPLRPPPDRADAGEARGLAAHAGAAAREYLSGRGLGEEVCRAFRLGYAPAGATLSRPRALHARRSCRRLARLFLQRPDRPGLRLARRNGPGRRARYIACSGSALAPRAAAWPQRNSSGAAQARFDVERAADSHTVVDYRFRRPAQFQYVCLRDVPARVSEPRSRSLAGGLRHHLWRRLFFRRRERLPCRRWPPPCSRSPRSRASSSAPISSR